MPERRLKILHILNELRFSGAETMLECAAPCFRAAGHDPHILATGAAIGPFAPALERAGYRLHHIPFAKSVAFFRAVRRLIAAERYDLVHIHCERAYPIYALLAAPTSRVVRSTHHLFGFTGGLRLRKTLERAFCRRVLGVTEINGSLAVHRNEIARFFAGGPLCWAWYNEAAFVPPTADQRAEARRRLGCAAGEVLLVSLGSNTSYKNYGLILDALARLDPALGVRYTHVGDQGPGEPLSRAAAERGLSGVTRFPGRVENALDYLWAADCCVMPSTEEGFGIAAVEAMAAGLPAILSNRPSLTDFAAFSPDIVYTELDAGELARHIAAMAATPDAERRRIGAGLAEVMRREFSAPVGAGRYISVYEGLQRV